MPVDRDRPLELELLERAGGTSEFDDQVLRRLAHYESAHGNTGWNRDVDELLQEIQEECADISGWALGAALQLDEAQLHRLVVAMALGARAHQELAELREQIALRDPR
jgi:hypothetical protein